MRWTSPTTRTVQLNNASGNLPVITLTNFPGTTTTASTVSLTATATDGDGFIESVEFFLNRNSLGFGVREQLGNLWRIPTSFAGLTAGSYEVQAVARDNAGNVSAQSPSVVGSTLPVSASGKRVLGYGERQPRASNATAAGMQQNRRVEVVCYTWGR